MRIVMLAVMLAGCGDGACDVVEWYEDADGDGYGNPESVTHACEQPEGYVPWDCDACVPRWYDGNCDDTDDTNPAVYPGSELDGTEPDGGCALE